MKFFITSSLKTQMVNGMDVVLHKPRNSGIQVILPISETKIQLLQYLLDLEAIRATSAPSFKSQCPLRDAMNIT